MISEQYEYKKKSKIDIHTHQSGVNSQILEVINMFPNVEVGGQKQPNKYFSMGIHPWKIEEKWQEDLQKIELNASSGAIIAIGETGLDRKCNVSFGLQTAAFEAQIRLAENLKLPLIIHNVRADNDLLELHKKWKVKQPWIIHGYHGNENKSNIYINNNIYLSFGKALISPKVSLQNTFFKLPLDRVFLETDDQTDYSISEIYEAAAQIKGIDAETLAGQISLNFRKVFQIEPGEYAE
jgi:TatD DNase family protein